MHINIETRLPVNVVKEIELDLVRQFNEASEKLLSGKCSIDDLEEMMRTLLTEVKQKKALLTKAVPDKSIVLYFFCSCPQALDNINGAFQSGLLRQCVEKIVIRHVLSTSTRVQPLGFISPPSINADQFLVAYSRTAAKSQIATVHFRVDTKDYKRCLENFSRGKRLEEHRHKTFYDNFEK